MKEMEERRKRKKEKPGKIEELRKPQGKIKERKKKRKKGTPEVNKQLPFL